MKRTSLESLVLTLFQSEKGPLSVPQLMKKLADHQKTPNKTTLYRQIQKLQSDGTLTQVTLNNEIGFYEYTSHHHHHVCCESCNTILCIEDDGMETQIHRLEHRLTNQNWKITRHEFTFTGLCPTCLSKQLT